MTKKIAFVGLGGMGRGVVKNIALKGGNVTVLDLDAAKIAEAEGSRSTELGLGKAADTAKLIAWSRAPA